MFASAPSPIRSQDRERFKLRYVTCLSHKVIKLPKGAWWPVGQGEGNENFLAFVVTEISVRDEKGYAENFLKAAQKDIADHGGKYLAGGYRKTLSLACAEPSNRVVILQFANMDQVKEWRDQGAMDLENSVGNKYASFRIYAVEGATP
jgi:uncharacterized protein (DUF1330 family)